MNKATNEYTITYIGLIEITYLLAEICCRNKSSVAKEFFQNTDLINLHILPIF